MVEPNLINVSGLALDIVGAGLVAWSIAFTSDQILEAQTLTVADGNASLQFALKQQRMDARFGLGFLIFGFIFQAIAALGYTLPLALWEFPAAIGLSGLVTYRVQHRRLRDSELRKTADLMVALNFGERRKIEY